MSSEKVTCECGSTVVKRMLNRHLQSKKHQDVMAKFGGALDGDSQGDDSSSGDRSPVTQFDMSSDSEDPVPISTRHSLMDSSSDSDDETGGLQDEDSEKVLSLSDSEDSHGASDDVEEDSSDEIIDDNDYWFDEIESDALDQFIYSLKSSGIRSQSDIRNVYNHLLGAKGARLPRRFKKSDRVMLGALLQKFDRVNRDIPADKLRSFVQGVLADA